ncbi:STAS domain-containing protein [Streptomyces sp. NPDC056883]|uniref:STAS domain-containing protein n=1 Tax=Streptomyces sp. NPDC056883 TaxID=3345959 RepID=UPI0036B85544
MGLNDFIVDLTEQPERIVVSVSGDIDYGTCPLLSRVLDTLALPGRILVLDLARVTFMGTSFLHVLLALRARAIDEEWTLELAGTPDQGQSVLELTATRGLFTLRPALAPAPAVNDADHQAPPDTARGAAHLARSAGPCRTP